MQLEICTPGLQLAVTCDFQERGGTDPISPDQSATPPHLPLLLTTCITNRKTSECEQDRQGGFMHELGICGINVRAGDEAVVR